MNTTTTKKTGLPRLTEAEAKTNMQGAYITLADGRTVYCEHLSERERQACLNFEQVTAQRDELLAALNDIETRAGYALIRPDKTNNDIQMEYIKQKTQAAISKAEQH